MAKNTETVTFSIPLGELAKIDERAAGLNLGSKGRSKLFWMLWELDKKYPHTRYFHESDGQVHFFPEEKPQFMAAEDPPASQQEVISRVQELSKAAQAKSSPSPSSHT